MPPGRSSQQRLEALAQANQIRALRAADKRSIKSRQIDARAVILSPAAYWEGARIADLLLSVPAIGHGKLKKILKRQVISPSRTLAGLTDLQRSRLIKELDRYYPG